MRTRVKGGRSSKSATSKKGRLFPLFQWCILAYVLVVGYLLGGPVISKHLGILSASSQPFNHTPLAERKLETVSTTGTQQQNDKTLQMKQSTSSAAGGGAAGSSTQEEPQEHQPQEILQKDDSNNFLPRVLAFVFPQFHRDKINDRLWGEGFTDWDNLRNAPKTNREGFAIPRPTELGYYDYSQSEPRRKQGELVKEYGLDGLIFHHYWFYDPKHPGPTLEAPLEAMLKDGYPDVPFALHWCASKWVNTWSGNVRPDFVFDEPNVLQKQYFPTNQTDEAITQHYQWLRQFFHHPNYIKVDDGKPLFMLYQKKPGSFPVLKRLKELARQDGFPGLYLTVGLTMPHTHLQPISNPNQYKPPPQKWSTVARENFDRPVAYPNPSGWNQYRTMEVPQWCHQKETYTRVPDIAGIVSSFDNTPRRNYQDAVLWSNDQPAKVVERFQQSLYGSLYYEACCFPGELERRLETRRDQDDRFIIINAMNEWAEGMALEPSDVFGRSFLEAIREAKKRVRESQCGVDILPQFAAKVK
ncbi:Lipopolysaccharide biosynthesis protein-like protein [Seminavis robusta]|uniref:Lipopolysaccharide biosynthesis protein-like protein n=1 Tax=Seminavis robusta TaxID=568900 RepID=A0A9N8E3U0_9STRA|nr:Lipopolysaccharide biosynthesis protein-like protein [Seminavis robusta]|eukprot:Sro631_g178490.1 Lipopolysaccharide biosynthesis protein-like protein (527) ;mRNA; f:25727-27417